MSDPRTLSRLVLEPGFTVARAIVNVTPAELEAAISSYESVKPLMHVEPRLDGPQSRAVADFLRPIGAKIAPTMSGEQANTWRAAMVLALSDLPPRVAQKATRLAIHKPMLFINEAETEIRKIAADMEAKNRLALYRLRTMRAEIERAGNPDQKQIADRHSDPITVSEVAGWPPEYRRIAVENDFITTEMLEAAEALIEERKAGIDMQAQQA